MKTKSSNSKKSVKFGGLTFLASTLLVLNAQSSFAAVQVFGNSNTLIPGTTGAVVGGHFNKIGGKYSLIFGEYNDVQGKESIATGLKNNVTGIIQLDMVI